MKRTSAILLSICFLIACKPKVVKDLDISNLVTAYTQGMINDTDPIEFRFFKTVQLRSQNLKEAITVNPAFDFTVEYLGNKNTIVIKPTKGLERGTDYDVSLDLNEILVDENPGILVSKLKTFEQNIRLTKKGTVLSEDSDSELELKLELALAETEQKILEIFDYPKEKISITDLEDGSYNVKIKFESKEGEKSLSWNGAAIGSDEKGTIVWDYFSKEFEVSNTHFDKERNQYVVYFSKILNPKQDAKGLIQIGNTDAKYVIDNNSLTVYLGNTTNENLNLKINKGLESKAGDKLTQVLNYQIEAKIVLPQVQFLESGVYIPHTGAFKIPFKAKGLDSILVSVVGINSENASHYAVWNDLSYMDELEMRRYGKLVHQKSYPLDGTITAKSDWNEYGIDMSTAFNRDKGMIYHIRLDIIPSHTILNCNEPLLDDYELDLLSEEWFDNRDEHYNYYRYFDYEDRQNPCKVAYYFSQGNASKTIHCTNVFPIIKKAGKDLHVAAKELLTNTLANGAAIDLLDLQGFEIESKTIQNSGTVSFTNLARKPQALRIRHQGETSFFPVRQGRENQLTEFDITSNVRDVDNKIFVYAERDVWRPSDTIFMDVMLNRSKSDFPEGLPIVVKLKNPKGVIYDKYIQKIKGDNSIYSFKMPTHLEAKTGYWTADITIGPLRKRKSLRVETIKPNVVELNFKLKDQKDDWIYANRLDGSIDVQYLTGFPMRAGSVESSSNIRTIYTPFDKYKNYSFLPRDTPDNVRDYKLFNVKTDGDGQAKVSNSHDFKIYKGVSKLVVDSKINLPGGGLNTETESFFISPFETYVGVQKSKGKGWRGSYLYGSKPEMEIIQLNQKGELVSSSKEVNIEVLKYTNDWWYDRYRLNRDHRAHTAYRYKTVLEKKVKLAQGKVVYTHDDPTFESGMYILKVTDPVSGHVAEHTFHYVANANYSVETNPAFINLQLEKENYKINETVKIELPQIKDAKALVSIESGDKVLDFFWTDLSNPNLELTVQDNWYPNFYLHVSIVQNYDQQNNDRPMRMYTVEKIKVNMPDRMLEPVIESEEKVEPNSAFTINVREETGQQMEYTLAVVDQGLLNLTGYRTPDPILHFAKTVALRVMTWDIFNLLIYHNNPSFAGILSIGGDAALDKKQDESADFNRFEPVVFHLGPFTLPAGGTKTHNLTLPNYLGQLKVMVVACNQTSYGSTDDFIKVVSPLMVQSQLPRSLNITDRVEVPVTLFKDEASIKDIKLTGVSSSPLVTFEKSNMDIALGDDDQKVQALTFTTGEESATVDIGFNATSGRYKSEESSKIFINYPNSYTEKEERFKIPAGEKLNVGVDAFGFEKTKNVDITVSGALIPNFSKHYENLIGYPYGCLEQTTSKAFGMLYIEDLMNVSPRQKKELRDNLDAAITKIQSFQTSSGRFNYWRNGYYNSWSNMYAAHFLIEARDKNLLLKTDALDAWVKNKTEKVNKWRMQGIENKYLMRREANHQAYGLYLLAKSGSPAKSAMNRFKSRTNLPQMAKVFLAGAYYYANMDQFATTLLNDALDDGNSDSIDRSSFGSVARNKAIIIYMMSKLARTQQLDRYYEDWVNEVNSKNWLSTQEQGFMFLAAKAYLGEQNISEEIEFDMQSKKFTTKEKLPSLKNKNFNWTWEELTDGAEISNLTEGDIYVTKTERAISKELYGPKKSNGIAMTTSYASKNGGTLDFGSISQGDDIDITISIKNTDIIDHENLALTFKVPSGWELLNPRLYSTNEQKSDNFVFQDFRDDKVYTFFTLNKNKTKTFRFRAKASLKGDYYMPAVLCEDMYNGEISAKSKATRAVIK